MANTSFLTDLEKIISPQDAQLEKVNREKAVESEENILSQEKNRISSLIRASVEQGKRLVSITLDRNMRDNIFEKIVNFLKEEYFVFYETNGNNKERFFEVLVQPKIIRYVRNMEGLLSQEREKRLALEEELKKYKDLNKKSKSFSESSSDEENTDQNCKKYGYKATLIHKIKDIGESESEILLQHINFEEKIKKGESSFSTEDISHFRDFIHRNLLISGDESVRMKCGLLRNGYNLQRKNNGLREIHKDDFPTLCYHVGIRKVGERRKGYAYIEFKE